VKTDVNTLSRDEAKALLKKLCKAQDKFGADEKRAELIRQVRQRIRDLAHAQLVPFFGEQLIDKMVSDLHGATP
jgi:uncharacterized protein YpuA (DUF1002 family)